MRCTCMQGNCDGPPSEEEARQLNLPDSAVESMQAVRAGQCVILISKTAFLAKTYNKWFDNLHIVIVSDSLVPQTITAISAGQDVAVGPATNLFFTRMTFHATGGISAAQAFAIPPDKPEGKTGVPGLKTEWTNDKHAVMFQGAAQGPALSVSLVLEAL